MCRNAQPGHQSAPHALAVTDCRLLWPAQDKGFWMKKRSWKMWVLTKINFLCCAGSTCSLAISPLLLTHLQESPAQALLSCTLTMCQSFSKVHWGPCCPNTSGIVSSQRPQWWTHISNSNTEPWQGKFDKLLPGLPLITFSSDVSCNLSLDVLHPLRAVLILFPLTCSVEGDVSTHHPSQRYCRYFSPHSNVHVGAYFKHTVTNLTFGILLD